MTTRGNKRLAGVLLLCLVLEMVLETSEAFVFGPMGQLECGASRERRRGPGRFGRPGRPERPGRGSCTNCKYSCRCTGDGRKVYYRVSARYRMGRCIPRNRIMLNCDRFQWCQTCRTNLPERDYHGCKRYLPGAPRHH